MKYGHVACQVSQPIQANQFLVWRQGMRYQAQVRDSHLTHPEAESIANDRLEIGQPASRVVFDPPTGQDVSPPNIDPAYFSEASAL